MAHPQFYTDFVNNLTQVLLQNATNEGLLGGQILTTEDFDDKWTQIAPEYMADAVQEIAEYPSVAIAWAAYLGMGVAVLWDTDWGKHAFTPDTYKLFKTPRGFDAMDEYVMEEVLGIPVDSEDFSKVEVFLRNSAQLAMTLIRKENIPPQSIEAYQLFSDCVTVFFRLGASLCLHGRGYAYHPAGN
ncbi:MAG: hypothetical protein PHU68_01335 [Paludibacter sp.]|nr:hypothetical protein [Paludibacter sp.]